MRSFNDGDTIDVEPWRAAAVPGDQGPRRRPRAPSTGSSPAGGYITAPTGAAPDAHAIPVPKHDADAAMDAATCIGCGACVAACPNGSATLFPGAKITHLGVLPQGQPERRTRALAMVDQHDAGGLRRLHQHRRVHGGVPEGDPARRDLPLPP